MNRIEIYLYLLHFKEESVILNDSNIEESAEE